jgi:hypothetical protein
MAENLSVQFFTDAKAQFESAGKWRWIVVALLAYLHIGLVMPFATDTRDKAAVDRELADNRAAEEVLKPVLDAADKLANRVNVAKDQVAADLKATLIERFRRLSGTVSALSELNPAQAEGDEGAALFAKPVQQQQMQQQMTQEDPSVLAPMSSALRRRIAETASAVGPGVVPPELQAYIESGLIAPAFRQANEEWAQSGSKIAQDGAAAIAENIAKAKAATPAATAELDRLEKSMEALDSEAQHLTFAPPRDPAWWRTVRGKEASILSMTSDFSARVGDFNTSQMALQTLTTRIDDIVSKNQQAATALNNNLVELDKRAVDLQSQLSEIGAPLKVVSFKLSEIAPLMPLIIAATLAVITAWTAEGLHRMTLVAELVGDEADGMAIRTWLRAAAGGSRARVAGIEVVVAIASVAWVLAATWNVAPLPVPFLTHLILTAIAVAVVLAARAYHWCRANEAMSLVGC